MQLEYTKAPAIGKMGMKAGSFEPCKVLSKLSEAAGLGVGVPVEAGSDVERQVVALTAAADFMGVSLCPQGMEQAADGSVAYAQDEQVPVMEMGRVYVMAGAAVAAGVEVVPATTGKFAAGEGTSAVRAFAVEAAAADGDLLLIELTGKQGGVTA